MLELNRISAGYGKQTVLNDVSAFFEKGKLTSIIGVNGCGKSTLLKAILGILPLSGGEITVDGENLLTMSRNEIAKKIAYLSQGRNTPAKESFGWLQRGYQQQQWNPLRR